MAIQIDGKLWNRYIRVFDVKKDQKQLDEILNNPNNRVLYRNIEFTKSGVCLCVIEYLEYVKDLVDDEIEKLSKEEQKQLEELNKLENKATVDEFLTRQAIVFGKGK